MPIGFIRKFILGSIAALPILTGIAAAGPITSIVVYGDSLSDNGNLFAAAGQPGPPYFEGRRSNGPVAVEQLASSLGLPLVDNAWIGATTGIGNYGDGGTATTTGMYLLPGMQVEFASTEAALGPFLANSLFIVWGGANDFLSPSPLDATPLAVANRAVSDIAGIVSDLQGLGAQHILVPGMPDLGLTPYFQSLGPLAAAQASAITNVFNSELQASLPSGVLYYDTAGLLRNIVADPAAYGFTNVTDPCFNGATVCSNPGQYLFWDDLHPTTATASYVAAGFRDTVVPEPADFLLAAGGLALCIAASRIRKCSRFDSKFRFALRPATRIV